MRLEISREALAGIRAATAAAHPLEACGLLFGDESRIAGWLEARNLAERPDIEFEIDPAALFAALRAERAGGPRLIGYWHSHPSGDVEPSQRDAEMADIDGKIWIIVSSDGVAAWELHERPNIQFVTHPSGRGWTQVIDGTFRKEFDRIPLVTGDARDLVPLTKHDEEQIPLLREAGYPAIAPILDDLMQWTADPNWPICMPLIDYLNTLGEPLVEPIRRVLRGTDSGHKYVCLAGMVPKLPWAAQLQLRDDLLCLVEYPSDPDRQDNVDTEARAILAGLAESGG